jgi:hypothetical protein
MTEDEDNRLLYLAVSTRLNCAAAHKIVILPLTLPLHQSEVMKVSEDSV